MPCEDFRKGGLPRLWQAAALLLIFTNVSMLLQAPTVFGNWDQTARVIDEIGVIHFGGPWELYGALLFLDVTFVLMTVGNLLMTHRPSAVEEGCDDA